MNVLLGLALSLFALMSTGLTAQPAASGQFGAPTPSLTIRNRVCPVEFSGADYYQACTEPVANMEFALTAPFTAFGLTDAAGVITFANLPSGTYEVTGGPPGEFVQNAISCRLTYDPTTARPYLPRHNRAIAVTLVESDITCDWYSIPFDLRGDG
jgi:hypothetical protein